MSPALSPTIHPPRHLADHGDHGGRGARGGSAPAKRLCRGENPRCPTAKPAVGHANRLAIAAGLEPAQLRALETPALPVELRDQRVHQCWQPAQA